MKIIKPVGLEKYNLGQTFFIEHQNIDASKFFFQATVVVVATLRRKKV